MKIPITDQFLWMIYEFFEKTGDILEPPEIFKLKSWRNIVPLGTNIWKNLERKRRKGQFSQFINYLKKKGYIQITNLKEKRGILVTKKGKEKVLKIKLETKEKKKRNDGKWQMLIFDIPERKRHLRDILRVNLYLLDYKMLQQSVWVCPYDVLKETEAILTKYSLDPYVKLFLIEEIEF